MPQTVLVLTEHALAPLDIANIQAVSPSEDVEFRLIVPTETSRSVVLQVIDSLALLDLREAWGTMTGERNGADPPRTSWRPAAARWSPRGSPSAPA